MAGPNDVCLHPVGTTGNNPRLGLVCTPAIVTFTGATFPDRLDRPVAQQPDGLVYTPQPPAVAVVLFFAAYGPDQLRAPPPVQPDSFSSPILDRRTPAAAAFAPERIDRPRPQQPDAFVIALRERTATFFDAQGPPRFERPRTTQPDSLASPLRDRTSPAAATFAPDRLDRPRAQQPENQPPIRVVVVAQTRDWLPVYPDRFARAAPQQPDPQQSIHERTAPAFGAVFPDRLTRPTPQQPDAFVTPIRDRTTPAADAFTPAQLARTKPAQPPSSVEPVRERTAPAFDVVFPDRITRPGPQQPPALSEPRLERVAPPADVVAPTWLVHVLPTQPASSVEPQLERKAPAADAFYPDRLVRPALRAVDQLTFAFVKPEDVVPFAEAYFPDRLGRPDPSQPSAQETPIEAVPFFDAVFPDNFRPHTQQTRAPSFVEPPFIPPVFPPTSTGSGSHSGSFSWVGRKRRPKFVPDEPSPTKPPPDGLAGTKARRKQSYSQTHPRVLEAKRTIAQWMDPETFKHIPEDLWFLFANPRIDAELAYNAAREWAEHVKEVRATFADVSHGPEEERIWAAVNLRWAQVWAAFVRRLALAPLKTETKQLGAPTEGAPAEATPASEHAETDHDELEQEYPLAAQPSSTIELWLAFGAGALTLTLVFLIFWRFRK